VARYKGVVREIQVGLIGYGFGGSVFHAPLIRRTPGLRLAAIVTSRREQVERTMPGVRVLASVAELLADDSIPAVAISSPSGTHFEMGCAAIAAGKHVVMDKPLALTAAEAEDLMARAKAKGLILTPFQDRRWDGDFLTVRKCVEEGLLGAVYSYEAHYDRYRPAVAARWKEQAVPGSGILYDLGPHLIDQALQLFGMPRAVTADILFQREGASTVDYFHLVLDYGRLRAILHSSMLVKHAGPHYAVHGDRGSYLTYGMDPQEAALMAGKLPGDRGWDADIAAPPGRLYLADGTEREVATLPGVWQTFYARLAECLLRGGPLPVEPADARDGLAVVGAALRSASERRAVDL
jgi:scyllo-inositol 2-dehydrogenase (NADP+)